MFHEINPVKPITARPPPQTHTKGTAMYELNDMHAKAGENKQLARV